MTFESGKESEGKQHEKVERKEIKILGYVWFPKNAREKNAIKNNFLMFDFTIENMKENQI